MAKSKSRALTWSKEVERRVRDLYKNVYPTAERTKRHGVEDYEGCPDLVGVPFHVQVKARSASTINTLWKAAESVRVIKRTGNQTHLVTQAANAPVLVTLKLEDYVKTLEELEEWRKFGMDNLGSIPPKLVVRTVMPLREDSHP